MAGFSQTHSYGKEWTTNRCEGLVQTEERCCTADALDKLMTEGSFGLCSLFLGYFVHDAEEN